MKRKKRPGTPYPTHQDVPHEVHNQSQPKHHLTTKEACAFLGIKPQTLYAYVSRGLVRAETAIGQRHRVYPLVDLDALRAKSRARSGHGPTAASAMRWGEPILESSVTCIQNQTLYYRGHSVGHLLKVRTGFENVAELLWSGDLPRLRLVWPVDAQTFSLPKINMQIREKAGAPMMRHVLASLSQVSLWDSHDSDETLDISLLRARRLILSAATVLFDLEWPQNQAIPMASAIAAKVGHGDIFAATEAIEAALIACADHELNASTFAARIASSTGADLYACILSGIATFSGPNHGLSPFDTYTFVKGAMLQADLPNFLEHVRTTHGEIPGFGHRLYPDGDPRGKILLDKARAMAHSGDKNIIGDLTSTLDLIEIARSLGAPAPNLDLGLTAIAIGLGLSGWCASGLFLVGRMAGWTAHVLEQRQQGFIRPRARYNGRIPTESDDHIKL